MTDISESGIEAALRAGDFSVDSKTKAKMRRMLKAYLPFHPPASREDGLREAADACNVEHADCTGTSDWSDGYRAACENIHGAILALQSKKPE